MTSQSPPEAERAAPQRPPINAWLELEGRPNHHVIRFQMMAPRRAEIRTWDVTIVVSTRPDAIVFATAVPTRAPVRSIVAASRTAWRGVRTLVETTVAIELAVS